MRRSSQRDQTSGGRGQRAAERVEPRASRADEHGNAAARRGAEEEKPARVRPPAPEEIAGAAALDKPSQAEGNRETVEEDLRIQEERQRARGRGKESREGR